MKSAYKNLVGKPEGKRPLGRRRRKWEDIIRMNLGVHLDRDQWRVHEHGNELGGFIKCVEFFDQLSEY
jgi:hypothetical protein